MEELFKAGEEKKEQKIKELEKSLVQAKELNLERQIKIYENCLHTVKNEEIKIKHNYVKLSCYDHYGGIHIEDYKYKIPEEALEELVKATAIEIFDHFEVWTDVGAGYILVGISIEDDQKSNFKIAEW